MSDGMTRNEVAKELKRLGWKVKSRMWYPPVKRGYCEIWSEAQFGEGGVTTCGRGRSSIRTGTRRRFASSGSSSSGAAR